MDTRPLKKLTEIAERITYSPVEEVYSRIRTVRRGKDLINLASGNPDRSIVPVRELAEIAFEVLTEDGYDSLIYPGSGGLNELKKEIEGFMASLGVRVPRGYGVIVTSGAQHAFKLISELLVDEKTVVVCEDPTFFETLAPLRLRSGRVVGVRLKNGKINAELLSRLVKEAEANGEKVLVYLIPTCHNPTGYTMSEEERSALAEKLESSNAIVVEDDPYRALAPVKNTALLNKLGSADRVYVGSLSKVLAPGLRIGWVIAPDWLCEKLSILENYDIAISTLTQSIALRAFKKGLVVKQASKLPGYYLAKQKILEDSLRDYMPDGVSWEKGSCGFFRLIRTGGLDPELVLNEAINEGVVYVPARRFYVGEGPVDVIRLSIGPEPPHRIREGVERLARVFKRRRP